MTALLNVNGISICRLCGLTGARLVGHALTKRRRRDGRYVEVTMRVGGVGAADLFEGLQ